MSVIEVNNLCKSFAGVCAVDDLSFSVEPGRVTGFLGRNGAGKTTTLRMILGLVTPDSGTALIDGVEYARLETPVDAVGAVLEVSAFHPGLSAEVHLRALCTAAGVDPGRVDTLLDEVELDAAADRRVGEYSLGMRQRLALASALIGDPAVLVLDEPANGLDPEGVHWLRSFVRSRADAGVAVLMSSHILAEMEQTADHIVVLNAGRAVAQGSLSDLTNGSGGLEKAYLDLVKESR